MKIKNLIFDVDGTLWDSSSSVAASWNRVLQRYDETKHIHLTQQDEYRFMGHTMTEIAEMMLPGLPDARRTEIMDSCMADENAYLMSHPENFMMGFPIHGRCFIDPVKISISYPTVRTATSRRC